MLQEAVDVIQAGLTAAGIVAATDPRNIKPPCALIDPPSFVVVNPHMISTTTIVHLIAPGPGNRDAAKLLMQLADDAVAAINVVSGSPSTTTVGSSDFPSYDLTVTYTIQS